MMVGTHSLYVYACPESNTLLFGEYFSPCRKPEQPVALNDVTSSHLFEGWSQFDVFFSILFFIIIVLYLLFYFLFIIIFFFLLTEVIFIRVLENKIILWLSRVLLSHSRAHIVVIGLYNSNNIKYYF